MARALGLSGGSQIALQQGRSLGALQSASDADKVPIPWHIQQHAIGLQMAANIE